MLISHLSESESSSLKISRIHWHGRVLWTERASLESFVHKKNEKCVQMCQLITLSEIWFLHNVLNFLSNQTGFLSGQNWPWPDKWPSKNQELFAGLNKGEQKVQVATTSRFINFSPQKTLNFKEKFFFRRFRPRLIGNISLQRIQIFFSLLYVTCIMLHNSVSLITIGQYLVQRSSLERPLNVKNIDCYLK